MLAGPFNMKAWKDRYNKTFKSHISVFVCITTRASPSHLELAWETAEALSGAFFVKKIHAVT